MICPMACFIQQLIAKQMPDAERNTHSDTDGSAGRPNSQDFSIRAREVTEHVPTISAAVLPVGKRTKNVNNRKGQLGGVDLRRPKRPQAKRKWVPPSNHPWREAARRGEQQRARKLAAVAERFTHQFEIADGCHGRGILNAMRRGSRQPPAPSLPHASTLQLFLSLRAHTFQPR
jgi:hypothetical protein